MTFTKEYTNTKKRSLAPIVITVEAENGREAFTKIFRSYARELSALVTGALTYL